MPEYLAHTRKICLTSWLPNQIGFTNISDVRSNDKNRNDDPQPSQLDSYSSKRSKNFRDRWNHSIPTQLHSECFWKHSLSIIKLNKAPNCTQNCLELRVDSLRPTGRYLKATPAASNTTKQYRNCSSLLQTSSHSPVPLPNTQ